MVTHSGYYCLLLQLDECGVQRCLYVKRHEHSDHESEQSAALFVAGIPIKLEDCLDEVFGAFGSVEQVQLHPRRTSAVIVFSQQNTVSKVLAAAKKGALVAFATNNQATDQHPTGLRKYVEVQKARCPGNDKLEQELNSWMVAFEESEERKRRALEAAAADDGWTLVTRKAGRKRKNGSTVTGGVSQAAAEAYAANKKSKLAADFYRFQSREQKRNELVELQHQFAAAKKQVFALRTSRKFQG